jgi:hypothetical protein
MMNKIDFRQALTAWVEEEGRASGGHPDAETLRDYRDGLLAPDEEAPVDEHLLACRQCFGLAQDLAAFFQARRAAAGPPAAVADFESAAFWRALRPRLPPREAPAERRRAAGAVAKRWHLPVAVAASVLLTALGFSFWMADQQRALAANEVRMAALQAPRPNTRIYDLFLDTSERSGESQPQPVALPAGSMLLLTPRDFGDFPGYAVEILDAGGKRAWAGGGFAPDPEDGTLTLWLPPDFLEPGEYRVRLLGGDADSGELIEEYVVQMVP